MKSISICDIKYLAVILYFAGIWINFKKEKINKCLPYIGMVGIILSELINLLTWGYPSTSYLDGIKNCFSRVFPMFYVGLIISVILIFVYRTIDKNFNRGSK